MNKISLLAVLTGTVLFLSNSKVIAQNESASTKFGLQAGINLSQYTKRFGQSDFKARTGYYLGIATNLSLAPRIKWQPELLFAVQGSKFEWEDATFQRPDGSFGVGNLRFTINELTIAMPLLLQYRIGNRFYLQGGPQLGYIVDRRHKVRENSFAEFIDIDGPVDFDYDKFDFGVALGIGYQIGDRFDVNIRYYFGLVKRDSSFIKSSVLNLGLGYWL